MRRLLWLAAILGFSVGCALRVETGESPEVSISEVTAPVATTAEDPAIPLMLIFGLGEPGAPGDGLDLLTGEVSKQPLGQPVGRVGTAAGSLTAQVTHEREPLYSPGVLVITDPATGTQRRVEPPDGESYTDFSLVASSVSPDGARIVLTRTRFDPPEPDAIDPGFEMSTTVGLAVVELGTGERTEFESGEGVLAVWSRDGRWLVLYSQNERSIEAIEIETGKRSTLSWEAPGQGTLMATA